MSPHVQIKSTLCYVNLAAALIQGQVNVTLNHDTAGLESLTTTYLCTLTNFLRRNTTDATLIRQHNTTQTT